MKKTGSKYLYSGGILFVAMSVTNLINFAYNLYLSRNLTFAEYGILTLISTFWLFTNVIVISLEQSVNHRTTHLLANNNVRSVLSFVKITRRKVVAAAVVLSIIWLASAPFLAHFFHLPNIWPLIIFTPAFSLGFMTGVQKGYLQGSMSYVALSVVFIGEAAAKLAIAIALTQLGQPKLAYISVVGSVVISLVLAALLGAKGQKSEDRSNEANRFPHRFMIASLISTISSTAFIGIDVLLAKHYLAPVQAGQYAVLSLVGKMIYYFGSIFSTFIIAVVGRADNRNEDTNKLFWQFTAVTGAFCATAAIGLTTLGHILVPIMFGPRAADIVRYLPQYATAIALFTVSVIMVTYRLARQQYVYAATSLAFTIALAAGIAVQHSNIAAIVQIVLLTSIYQFLALIALHLWQEQGRFITRALTDLRDLFTPLPDIAPNGQKRILILNWRDLKHKHAGGAEVYVHELAKRWAAQGHKVTLFCGNDGTSKRHEIVDKVEIIRRGGFYMVYLWAMLYYLSKFKGNYDIVIDCHNGVPFFAPLYVHEPTYCIVHHVHQEVFKNYMDGPMGVIASFVEKYGMRLAYRSTPFITVSESSRRDIERLGLGRKGIEIIHSGVDLHSLVPGPKAQQPLVLYVGRLKHYKSVDVLLRAFAKVLEQVPNAKLIVAGDGDERNNLEQLAITLKITGSASFQGRITEPEKIALMQQAWVFVNPSRMEGWGITTIEANACGTPVIASDVPGLRDSVLPLKAGHLVEYGNADAFAEQIIHVITQGTKLQEMSCQSVKWASSFNWDSSANKSLALLREDIPWA